MADVKTVAVRLVSMHDDYKRGMKESGDATAAFSKVSTAALAAAGVAAVYFVAKAASAYVDYGKQIYGLMRISGESAEVSSKMAFAAQQTGVSTETLANGIKFLERNMAAANPTFKDIGVSITDAGGNLRDVHEVLLDTADAISHMTNTAERNADVLQIFGRSGLSMLPMLEKGRAGLMAFEAEAQKYGLVLSQDNIVAIKANVQAHRELDAAMQGLNVEIGQEVLPALTAVTKGLTEIHGPAAKTALTIGLASGAVTAIAVVAPKVIGALEGMSGASIALGAAMGVAAVGGIYLILKGLDDVQERSKKAQEEMSGSINWGDYDKAASAVDNERKKVEGLAEAWNKKSLIERANNLGDLKVLNDTSAQLEEDQKHFTAMTDRTTDLGKALGVSAHEAKGLIQALHFDPTGLDPGKYTPIIQEYARGNMTAAQAERALADAMRQTAMSGEERTAAVEAARRATKEANDEEKASIDPLYGMLDAVSKMNQARRNEETAERGLEEAHRGVATAEDNVVKADKRREDAARGVTDAVEAHTEAQRKLNDLLSGAAGERDALGVEAAKIALAEAQRKARGDKDDDPDLIKRKDALDLRRAELDLKDAEGAHAENVKAAVKDERDTRLAVADAITTQADAAKGYEDAQRKLADAQRGVTDADLALAQAHIDTGKAAMDLDLAQRNLATAWDTGDASAEKSRETLKRWVDQGILTQQQALAIGYAWAFAKQQADAYNPDAEPAAGAPEAAHLDIGPSTLSPGVRFTERPAQGPPTALPPDLELQALLAQADALGIPGAHVMTKDGLKAAIAAEMAKAPSNRFRPTGTAMAQSMTVAPYAAASPSSASADGGGYVHNGDIVIGTATERTPGDIVYEQRKLAMELANR